MYVASLGCQTPAGDQTGISLGLGKRGVITTVSLMALVIPQVIITLGDTCDKWKAIITEQPAMPLNVTLIIFALLLSHAGHLFNLLQMSLGSIVLQLISLLFIWIDLLGVVAIGKVGTMLVYMWSMGLLTVFPVVSILMDAWGGGGKKKRRSHPSQHSAAPKTSIQFPLYWPSIPRSTASSARYHIL